MLKVDNLVTPDVAQWEVVVKGVRNAFKSWDKADSEICTDTTNKNIIKGENVCKLR